MGQEDRDRQTRWTNTTMVSLKILRRTIWEWVCDRIPHVQSLNFRYRDQELRFTVHDSPDYYQLKVSVFNDDKKTDLIGETWVSLETLVVPGGGQNDLWHNLSCKGKYAGEIRIELTYYDTRPKEEKPAERRRESTRNGADEIRRESLSGPRQPKPLKRRPLPADPTDSSPLRSTVPNHSQSSPLSFTPPQSQQPPQYSRTPQTLSHRYSETGYSHDSPADGSRSYHMPAQGRIAMAPSPLPMESAHPEIYDPGETDYIPGNILGRYDSFENEEVELRQPQQFQANGYRDVSPACLPPHNSHTSLPQQSRHRVQPPSLPHSHSTPLIGDYHTTPEIRRRHIDQSYDQGYYGSSPSHSYQASPTPLDSSHTNYEYDPRSMQPSVEDDEPPPPPPVHRTSGSQLPQYEPPVQNRYHQVPAPSPLNIRSTRNSASPAPHSVQGMELYHPQDEYGLTPSPSSGRGLSHPGASNFPHAQHAHYAQPQRRQSQDPTMMSQTYEGSYGLPPSLVPGYNPPLVEDEPAFMNHEQSMSARNGNAPGPAPLHQHSVSYEAQAGGYAHSRQDAVMSKPLAARGGNQAHRSSAPMIKPQAVSHVTRTPIRKSVSPQPGPHPQSSVPFSPDSYEAFNPKVASASSINKQGGPYHTPELAKQNSRQALRESSHNEEPIIGDDGRIIDPSDHLPTETWAPEPELKNAKKAPEPMTRSRPSPQGAQPMPPVGRRPLRDGAVRPHSISTPIYAQSPDSVSPSSAPRNRLQKRLMGMSTQPNSSPAVPTLHSMPRSLPRSSTSDYPLREHENYAYGGGSPHYARASPTGPPPIPAKLPIAAGQEDYGALSLSEELRRIDIGVGAGSGRTRRSRF